MKLYRINLYTPDHGTLVRWRGSRDEASKALTQLCKDTNTSRYDGEIKPEEVPIDKVGLIAWLNANLSTDNG
jgi:hypothetical protein